jgi:hypothetical protein
MSDIEFENRLHSIASKMEYPRTPDIVRSVTARLQPSTRPRLISKALAWSLTVVLVLCSSLMLIPTARAAIIEFIQVGVVRIFRGEPTPAPVQETPASTVPVTTTPIPASDLLPILKQIAGKTTLDSAQKAVEYSILLPTYPAELGEPDLVYVQEAEGIMTILVWLDPQQSDEILLSLHFIPTGSWAINKMNPEVVQETNVNGHKAVWAEGPYPLKLYGSDSGMEFTRLIDGHVLIWADGDITYRLETDQSLEEALKIAESLEPIR